MQEQITRFIEMFNDALAMLPEFASEVWDIYISGYRAEALLSVIIPILVIGVWIFGLKRFKFSVNFYKQHKEDFESELEVPKYISKTWYDLHKSHEDMQCIASLWALIGGLVSFACVVISFHSLIKFLFPVYSILKGLM